MNYRKIYQDLISRHRQLPASGERHHIIPRSWGGTDDAANLVSVTLREHYVAHLLLVKLATTTKRRLQMICAVRRMTPVGRRTSRAYQLLQQNWLSQNLAYMSEVIGEHGETRRQLTTRRSARTRESTVINGRTLEEVRIEKLSKHHEIGRTWEHLSGKIFTGTALELSRRYLADFMLEPSKLELYAGTTRRHRGWRVKQETSIPSSMVAKRYSEIYNFVHDAGERFLGTYYELATKLRCYPSHIKKAINARRDWYGWRALEKTPAGKT